jgi:hypothetical protein
MFYLLAVVSESAIGNSIGNIMSYKTRNSIILIDSENIRINYKLK